ncbi:hypothetical protein HQ520_16310 [bacterium]|nr:hypothetical protein [bacterium]
MIRSYLINSVTHCSFSSEDTWGEATRTEAEVSCRIKYQTRLVRNQQGEQVVSAMRIYLAPDAVVTHNDKFTVDGQDHSVLAIGKPQGWATLFVMVDLQ